MSLRLSIQSSSDREKERRREVVDCQFHILSMSSVSLEKRWSGFSIFLVFTAAIVEEEVVALQDTWIVGIKVANPTHWSSFTEKETLE